MENTAKNGMTQKLVLSGIMIGLATVLSMVKVYELPMGGSITLLSMLPVCLLSVKYGVKWGLFSAFAYALIQMLLGLNTLMSWGLTPAVFIGAMFLDYLLAFTVLGFAGIRAKNGVAGIMFGIAAALILRFICHFTSGIILWGVWMPDDFNNVAVYSLFYNGSYMLPELIVTLIGAFALFSVPQTKRLLTQ